MSRLKRFLNNVILQGETLTDINVKVGSESSIVPATIHTNESFKDSDVSRVAVATTCIKILAETLGRIPPEVYKTHPTKGKIKDYQNYLYPLVHSQPNLYTNSNTFYQTLEYHRNYTGNSYAYVHRNTSTGRAESFEIILPSRVKGYAIEGGQLYYLVLFPELKEPIPINSADLLHFKMMSPDGVFGINPIKALSPQMSITKQGETSIDSFYKNNAMSPRAFKSIGSGAMAKKLRDEAKIEFAKEQAGAINAGKEIWLPANTEIQDLSISISDSQILESLKFTAQQIAALYGVPVFKATGDNSTSKFNSIEQIQLDYKQNVSGTTAMYRREFESKLLTKEQITNGASIESNEDALISPDTKTKAEYLKTLFNVGSISPERIAKITNLPSEGLSKDTFVPVNMMSVRVYEAKNKNPKPEEIK